MKITATSIFILALSITAQSSEDLPSPWSSVTFEVPRPSKEVAVVSIQGSEALSKVTLKIGTQVFEVPKAEFVGIELPQLHTAQLLFGAYWSRVSSDNETPPPYYLVQMRYGREEKFGEYPLVQFLFHDGKYQERIQTVRTSENSWQDYRKSNGDEPAASGTTTRSTTPKTKTEETEQDGSGIGE